LVALEEWLPRARWLLGTIALVAVAAAAVSTVSVRSTMELLRNLAGMVGATGSTMASQKGFPRIWRRHGMPSLEHFIYLLPWADPDFEVEPTPADRGDSEPALPWGA
jgi:hypothetical protein